MKSETENHGSQKMKLLIFGNPLTFFLIFAFWVKFLSSYFIPYPVKYLTDCVHGFQKLNPSNFDADDFSSDGTTRLTFVF